MKALILAALVAATTATAAQAVITVQTSDFLGTPTNYNGFEGLGSTTNYPGTPYTEQGITVEYVGTLRGIWTDSQAAEGLHSWYENGGGTGYTKVTFGGVINAVEFQAGSGWFSGSVPSLQYEVLLAGSTIATGSIAGVSFYTGFSFFGFSGGNFDELHLQVQQDGSLPFDSNAVEAGAYDAINFGGSFNGGAVPEPASWALMIAGFGMVGATMRRRKALAA